MSVGASAKQSVGVSERQDGNASELQGVGASGKQMTDEERVILFAKQYQCIVLLKGEKDIVSNGSETRIVEGGNAGMTKGGTGDVLAGLIAALACTNDPFISTIAGSYINKKAGDSLYETVGPFFNASDLADQIPRIMRDILLM